MATRAQQFEILATGVLYDGATILTPYVKFYAAGTTNAKNAYADSNKSVAITKKALDSQGRAIVYGDGIYKLRFYSGDPDAGGVLKFEIDGYKVTAVAGNARTITADTTGTTDDGLVRCDTTSNNIVYTLPDAATYPQSLPLTLKKTAAANTLTYSAASGQTIDGQASGSLSDVNAAIQLFSDGSSNWSGAQIVGTASTLGGYSPSTGTGAATIPVRNAAGLLPFRGALVYNTTGGASPTFTSESYDTDSIHSNTVNPGRLTVPTGVTKVRVLAQLLLDDSTSAVSIAIQKNGAYFAGSPIHKERDTNVSDPSILSVASPVLTVVAGDYFTIIPGGANASADSAGEISWFAMELIE